MRVLYALSGSAFLAYIYYSTKDPTPLIIFLSLYLGYEIVSRADRLNILKIPLSFLLFFTFTQQLLIYLNALNLSFLIPLSLGMSLVFSTSGIKYRHHLSISGTIVLALSMLFIPEQIPIYRYRVVLFLIIAVLAVTSLLPLLSEKFEFLYGERVALIAIIALSGFYYLSIRSTLISGLRNIADWLILLITFIYFAGKLRFEIEEEAKPHELLDFDSMAKRAEIEYIERGNPIPLAVFLTHNLSKAGVGIDKIENLLSLIIEREKVPKFAFRFEKELILRRRRGKREKNLRMIKEIMEAGDVNGD